MAAHSRGFRHQLRLLRHACAIAVAAHHHGLRPERPHRLGVTRLALVWRLSSSARRSRPVANGCPPQSSSAPHRTRGTPYRCQARAQPGAADLCHARSPQARRCSPSSATAERLTMPSQAPSPLASGLHPSSTTGSPGPPGPLHRGAKASQSLPAPAAPALSRSGHRPRGDGPEVSLRRAWAFDRASFHDWALQKRVKAVDFRTGTRCRFPIPPSPEHACCTLQAVVIAPMGSPLVLAQTLDTALDIRSGAAPCESMALRTQA